MLNRNVSLALCLSVIAGAAFAQSNQGTGYVFQFANGVGASGQFQGFIYNTQSLGTPVFNTTGPTGANQVIPKPDGSKFYVVGSGGVDDFNPTFTTPANINGVNGSPTQAVITPDGRYLLIASALGTGSSAVYVLNTTTDTIALTQAVSGSVIGMVVSRDATTAWILANTSGQPVIVILNLTKGQQVGQPVFLEGSVSGNSLGPNPQALTMSPLGLLYVSGGNQVVEIQPSTLTTAALNGFFTIGSVPTPISVNATAGPLQFSADGKMAFFINTTPGTGGVSLVSMALPSHALNTWPPYTGQPSPQFDSLLVASATRLVAHSPSDTTLWDVAPDFSTVGISTLNTVLPATAVLSIAVSNELPSSRYLYTLVGGGSQASIYRVDLTTNAVTSQASAALGTGTLQFAIVPPETNPTAFIQFNSLQTNLAPGATAAPLIARVLDPVGRPMFAVPVTFTGDPSLTFTNVISTTNEDGYAQATVTLGQAPGNYPVTLTAGSGTATATTTFSLSIPGGTTPTGPTNGPNPMTIISGNGQLFQQQSPTGLPLTVQLLDTNGNPLVNQNVTFTVAGPTIGVLDNPSATTDTNGMASTDFFPEEIPQNTAFESTTVTAIATQGGVTFTETIFQPNGDGTGSPIASVLSPLNTQTITAGEGDVVPNAISYGVFSGSFGESLAIPNVGIRIADPNNPSNNGPASCQGSPLSDATGTVTCNLIASCNVGLGLHGFYVSIGEYLDKPGWALNIVPGSTQALTIQGGNNQSGRPGAVLTLTATVADQCGAKIAGVPVTWKVISGSAVLTTTTTASNQGGTVSTQVTLGQTPGAVQIVASINASTVATYTETIQAVVGSIKLISGGGQVVVPNQAFAPIVFQVNDTNNNPIPGLVVNFGIASGSASINTPSTATNAQGQVTVNATAGNVPGTVTITATYTTFTASATLTVSPPGLPLTIASFVNAASGQSGLTPCGLALVTGTGLASGVTGVSLGNPLGIGPLPTTWAGVTIYIDGIPAPLQAVSNQNGVQQVNFQTPCEIPTGTPATVVVQVGTVSTQVTGVTVYPAQPGIFTFAGPSGVNYGWVISGANGSTLTANNLATPGQTYYLIATGLGQTTPAAATDSPGIGQTIPVGNITLAINNIGVPVTSVQYAEGAFGEYVITFQIPVPFTAGTNEQISLGVNVNSQTFYDNSPVVLPGIN